MRPLTKFIHQLVLIFRLENLFFSLNTIHPFFLKFIPLHREYPKRKRRIVRRHGIVFDLDISDYMQWHIYAMQTDYSWQKASESMKEGAVVLDVGANCGAFSLPLAYQAKMKGYKSIKIHAFEPNPFVFKGINKNLALNPALQDVVSLHPIGLGNEEGEFGIEFNQDNSGHGKIIPSEGKNESKVLIAKLDTFVRNHEFNNICFIKIDVEGFEPFVLKGAMQVILTHKPSLYIEVTEQWYQEKEYSQIMLFKYLNDLGYSIYAEQDERFVKIERTDQVYSDKQFNIWASYEK